MALGSIVKIDFVAAMRRPETDGAVPSVLGFRFGRLHGVHAVPGDNGFKAE